MNQKSPSNRVVLERRRGMLLVEVIVASAVLISIMIFVTSICMRIKSNWKDIRDQRRAVAELASKLDKLTMMPEEDLEISIGQLAVSPSIQESLTNVEISGRLYEDSIGGCVELTLTWEKNGLPDRSVTLSAWHIGTEEAGRKSDD